MQSIVRGDHLAGLWSSRALSELFWRDRTLGVYSVRAHPYRAPSWSLASVDFENTRYLPLQDNIKPMWFVVKYNTAPLTNNLYGQFTPVITLCRQDYTDLKISEARGTHV